MRASDKKLLVNNFRLTSVRIGRYIYLPMPTAEPIAQADRRFVIQFRRHKAEVEASFDQAGKTIYTSRDLQRMIGDQRPSWHLSTVPVSAIVDLLQRESRLSIVKLASEEYGKEERWAWGSPSPFALALSLRASSYLSHGTAVYLHGLGQDIPATFFVNKEQGAKEQAGKLTQESLDRAFSSQPRQSKLVFADDAGRRYVVISGKFTDRLEVGEVTGPAEEALPATKLERTLVDIAVRPIYSGGVHKVLEAYRAAQGRASVNVLLATLKKLGYLYPYHQAIGFYLERAGYGPRDLDLARRPGFHFDFYLTHGIKNREYSSDWRLHYPRGL
jgi:hypothetical protein